MWNVRLGSYSSSDLVDDVVAECSDLADQGDDHADVVSASLFVFERLRVIVPVHDDSGTSIFVVPYQMSVVSVVW